MSKELSLNTKKFIELNNFKELNSVQKVALDNFNSRKDVFIVSNTGTGKTHAYLIPICETINVKSNKIQVLISTPTRELAHQVFKRAEVLKDIYPEIRIALLSGGAKEITTIKDDFLPHIIIGTPGKLKNIFQKCNLGINSIQLLIIDEADMTLEYGFLNDLDFIFTSLIKHSKVMCFSATLKDGAKVFIKKYLLNPSIIYVKDKKKDPQITHYLVNAKHKTYNEALINVINSINPYVCLIFANTKEDCDSAYSFLLDKGYKVLLLHGGLEPRERRKALKELESNKYTYVVCSDVASRGIDIDACSHVISLGFPSKLEFYTHRVGRTGRNGRKGEAYTIYNENDMNSINRLKNEGINFVYKDVKGSQLKNSFLRTHHKKNSDEVEKQIKMIVSKKDKKVKPNYKKKKKMAIEKIKRKARREFIRNEIKKQRKERYKSQARHKDI